MSRHNVTELFQHNHFPSSLTPEYIRFSLLLKDTDFPVREKNESLRYLELGSGQGKRLNIHAAAVPEWEFWGIGDISASLQHNRKIAREAGLKNHLLDITIEELAQQGLSSDLPQFDIIAIDSAWSRSDEKNRRHIINILTTHLKTGGIVCMGYSAMPGCTALMPLCDLLLQQMNANHVGGEITAFSVQHALAFAEVYSQTKSNFFTQNPITLEYLESMKNVPYGPLTEELLNQNWKPFYFSEIASYMDNARCSFITSLDLHSQLEMCQPEGIVSLLHEEKDTILRETIRDYGLNSRTRLDVFARGIRRASPRHVEEQLDNMAFCLTSQQAAISKVILPSPFGQLVFENEIYLLFVQALAENHYRPKTLAELRSHPLLREEDPSLFLAVINILVAAGLVFPANQHASAETEKNCAQLNRRLCESSRDGTPQPALASPLLRSGIPVSRIEQLFLLAWSEGKADPVSCAKSTLDTLARQKELLFGENGTPLNETDSLMALEATASMFLEQRLPYLTAMGAVPSSQNL